MITYHNWWGKVDPEWSSLIERLFPFSFPIELWSVFGPPPTPDPTKVRVQFSGESTFYDPALFQLNMIPYTNANLPSLYGFFHLQLLKDGEKITARLQERRTLTQMASRFCLFSVSAPGSRPREDFFRQLSLYKKVDSCGKVFRNIDPPIDRCDTGHQSPDYFDFIGKYKFMICFENKSQPYYLTEKLINAYHANTIPIYWGCPNAHEFVNMDAILYLKPNYTETDVSALLQEIVRLDQDDDAYRKKFESIFFKTLPDEFDLGKIQEKIQHTLCKVFPSSYIPISGTTGWSKVGLEDALKDPAFRPYIASHYENPLFYFSPGATDFSKVVPGISRNGLWTLSREEIHRYPKSYYESIDYFVIHCSANEERAQNILLQEARLGHPIQRFEAILGKEILLNRLDQYDPRIKYTPFKEKRGMNEIGCYLSHFQLIKSRKHLKTGYTVIFEDDFHIVQDLDVRQIIQDAGEFDILYLGHWTDPNRYKHVKGEIYEYYHSGPLYFLHAYVLPNTRMESIYETLLDIREPIDWVMIRLLNQSYRGKIVHPQKVIQNRDQMESIIGPIL